MKKLSLILLGLMLLTSAIAQQVVVTFSGKNYLTDEYVQLTRIEIQNKTKGWSETLTYPDTTAIFTTGSGVEGFYTENSFALQQNVPNPFEGTTDVVLTTSEAGIVTLEIMDMNGRTIGANNYSTLPAGTHHFRITLPAAGIYLLTAHNGHQSSSIKMVNTATGKDCRIALESTTSSTPTMKKQVYRAFDLDDEMLYTGYAMDNGEEWKSYAIAKKENVSEELVFDFTHDTKPCQDAKTVTDYDKNLYTTVQLGKQCWMVENMRTTHFADGTEIGLGYSSSAPCRYIAGGMDNMVQTCGYLYNGIALKYGITGGSETAEQVQGPCPKGWHVPTQPEWLELFGYVRDKVEYICGDDDMNFAKALSANFGWSEPFMGLECSVGKELSTNNATGFTVVPAGYNDGYKNYRFGEGGFLWTSSPSDMGYRCIAFNSGSTTIVLSSHFNDEGLSVRCVKD